MFGWRRGAIALLVLVCLGIPRATTAQQVTVARVTSYLPTGNVTASGVHPYPGSAACSWNYPLYTRFVFHDGREVLCIDRGDLGWSPWVDVFVESWSEVYYLRELYGDWANVAVYEPGT